MNLVMYLRIARICTKRVCLLSYYFIVFFMELLLCNENCNMQMSSAYDIMVKYVTYILLQKNGS